MKKILRLGLVLILSFAFISCTFQLTTTTSSNETTTSITTQTSETTTSTTTLPSETTTTNTTYSTEDLTLSFYSLNDFHGAAYSSFTSLSKMANYLNEKNENENAIILATGDIFQGSALSNYYYGLPFIETFNFIGMDAFTIGNHEFDWGIDKIALYNDDLEENGEAEFSFLAANIVYTDTNELLPFATPYEIIEVEDVRIGIIGVIGEVINSIAASRVEGITFLDPEDTIKYYAEELRTTENCDIVIASVHGYSEWMNNEIASFTGDSRVDAVFNGHTHTNIASSISRNGASLPFAQVSSYDSSLIASITLVYDRVNGQVKTAESEVLGLDDLGGTNAYVDQIIDVFSTDTEYVSFVTRVLAHTTSTYDKYQLSPWGASCIRDYASVDIGIVNAGGFRVSMGYGDITMGDLVEIYPFDNVIKTVYLTGATLSDLYGSGDLVFDDQVSYSNGSIYLNGVKVNSTQLYSVGAVDYVFDKTYYPFLSGENIQITSYFMRDLLAQDLTNHETTFNPANGTSYPG